MPTDADARSLIEHGMPWQRGARRPSPLLALLRIAVGAGALAAGVRLALVHQEAAGRASAWGLPAPSALVPVGAALLVLLGLLLLLGLASRLAALGLLAVALVTVATAGRVDGGVALVGGGLLAAGCLVLVARGGGAGELLRRLDPPDAP